MPQVIYKDDPIEPLSVSGIWRSTAAQLKVYRRRPAPSCAFLLALLCWLAAIYRLVRPEASSPGAAGVCLDSGTFAAGNVTWRKLLLHPLWPLEASYSRGFALSVMLILEGYALEYELGTATFAGFFVGMQAVCAGILVQWRHMNCFVSVESALVAMAMVMHRNNPKVHTDGLDKTLHLPFVIEPRWHLWFVHASLLMLSEDFAQALAYSAVGLLVGAACVLRDPQVWSEALQSVLQQSFTVGAGIHIVVLLFAMLFMPLSATELQWGAPGTPPLLHLAVAGTLGHEARLICKWLLSFALPLLLSPLQMWTRFYAGACLLLAMYTMNSPIWRFPSWGFATLLYLVYAFWKLPSFYASKLR